MDQDPPEDIMREYDTRVVTSLKALQQTAASISKVREGKRKGLEAERKERVAAETERLREGQKERKESLGYPNSGPVCGERTLTTAQKLSERTNRARIISICPLHNIVGV